MNVLLEKYHCNVHFIDTLEEILPAIEEKISSYSSCALLYDDRVQLIWGERLVGVLKKLPFPVHEIGVGVGETAKSLDTVDSCWMEFSDCKMDRKSLVISFGGGATSDVAGFIAGTYMRGIDIIHIPTSLLAMVDASIGGKTGINLPQGKNLVGMIHHPKHVLIIAELLETLPEREFRSGIAEIIKSAVVWDAELFALLEETMPQILNREPTLLLEVIKRTCGIKAEIVGLDEKEHGVRAHLNWGHTIGHALETLTGYNDYLHGEAVAIGMSCAAYISAALGETDEDFIDKQDKLILSAGLPVSLPKEVSIESLISQMTKDKKASSGKISLIVAQKVGKVIKINAIDNELIRRALKFKQERDTIERA